VQFSVILCSKNEAENPQCSPVARYGRFLFISFYSIPHQKDRQCGPRILTFFLYLSDVEAGGGTNFPNLDISIMPKKGRALLWPSVLDSNPMIKDGRLLHQALPVEEGIKYAANGWIHMYDYQTPQKEGCN
jgi:prolyl 4-hydroxylase